MRSRFITALMALAFTAAPALSQGVGGISPRAFGAKARREPVATAALLPATGNSVGDDRLVLDTLTYYAWTGSAWAAAGGAGSVGPQGPAGTAATVTVGSTLNGEPGTNASVTNSGSPGAAVLDFVIPRGDAGPAGADGADGLDGEPGQDGQAATVAVGTVTTGDPGAPASVTNAGSPFVAVFNFSLPRGDVGAAGAAGVAGATGPTGAPGTAATVTVGSTTTGPAGSSASVANVGTSSAAVLDFTIPRGDAGASGADGAAGATGAPGATGATGPAGPVAGSDTQLVFNDAGVAAGGPTYAKATGTLTVSGPIRSGAGTGASNLGLRIGASSGFWEVSSGNLLLSGGGSNIAEFNYSGTITSFFQLTRGGGSSWWLRPVNGSATVPSQGPRADDLDTGLGGDGANTLSLIAGGVETGQVTSTALSARKTFVTAVQALTVADNGNGATRATGTLTPTTSYVRVTCNDANGCDVPISESGAVDGQLLRIVCATANVCGFADTSGISEMAGNFDMGPNDALSFIYSVDRWLETGRSDN